MTDDLPALKPCPFCGAEVKTVTTTGVRDGRRAWCRKCGAAGGPAYHGPLSMPSAERRARDKWNQRAEDSDGKGTL